MRVELIYDRSCPNVESARAQLLRGFAVAGFAPHWHEWDSAAADSPGHARGYGSPTILVDGRDVSGDVPVQTGGNCCRIYAHGERDVGVPALADIVQALKSAPGAPPKARGSARWSFNSALLPAIGLSLLPKLTCPACWPAYAGLLSSVGVGFFDYTPYLLPLTAGFLLVAIAGLAWRARARRGYRPLLLGLAGSVVLLAGKFAYDSDTAMYAGIAVLVAASLWNTWPRARTIDAHGRENDCENGCGKTEWTGDDYDREKTH